MVIIFAVVHWFKQPSPTIGSLVLIGVTSLALTACEFLVLIRKTLKVGWLLPGLLALVFLLWFQRRGGIRNLNYATTQSRKALLLCPQGFGRTPLLIALGFCLWTRYEQLGGVSDLDEAIVLNRESLELAPSGEWRLMALYLLAACLSARYSQLGGGEDLDEAIVFHREALDHLQPPGDSLRPTFLSGLAVSLTTRYGKLGAVVDLNEAIVLTREALQLVPQGNPMRAAHLNNLNASLSARYDRLGMIADLDEAIASCRESLTLHPRHLKRTYALSNLSISLLMRYKQTGAGMDLDESIVLSQEALELLPQGHSLRSTLLGNLALCLLARYDRLGAVVDLDKAIAFGRETLELHPQGHPNLPNTLHNLSLSLYARYTRFGAGMDLDESIVLTRKALEPLPQGHPRRSTLLDGLAAYLEGRYNQLGAVVDLDEGIVLTREAVELCPRGQPRRPVSLNNLAEFLMGRYTLCGIGRDLDEAIVLIREAVELLPREHPHYSMFLNNLAASLCARYDRLGTVVDLDEAIDLHREALRLRPQGHLDRSASLNNLSSSLATRYDRFGTVPDLNEAIVLCQEAVELHLPGYPTWSLFLRNLATYLRTRFARTGQVEDKEALFSLYHQLVNMPQTVSSTDLSAAQDWVRFSEAFRHPSTVLAYETFLRLLTQHLPALPLIPQNLDILKKASSTFAVDAFSACLRHCSASHAVELLEQGRGLFWGQLARFRSPLDDVIASGPAGTPLANEFSRLTSHIRKALSNLDANEQIQHDRLYHLHAELNRVVTLIRELPGLSHFLLPLPFAELQCAASGGPVIIVNDSQYSCDALVVLYDRDPIHIQLQIRQAGVQDLSMEVRRLTARSKTSDMTRELALLLRKLWDQIVSPIVDSLLTVFPTQSRIWWCPTGEFSVLPLHAASPFRKGQHSLSDLYISSYTTTLYALIRARRLSSLGPVNDGTPSHIVAIGQASAVGETELFSVDSELAHIGQLVDGLATFTLIDGADSCISRVSEELGKNQWVHLACHGLPNRDKPFESAFALHDGHFTIRRIIQCEPADPLFAYLSACHTTVGDEGSPDEGIHLASAMQFAGFRSVIGTMWAVDDGETNKITSLFYKHMVDDGERLDYTRAAYALHKTMRSVKVPLDQRILYVHLGA